MRQTPLHALHLELGAKMAPFAGHEMPIHYPRGIIREHLHCRSLAGFFDISHMGQCLIFGDGAAEALERLTPGRLSGLTVGRQKYTVLTNENGGVIDDIIVTRTNGGLAVVVNAARKDRVFPYLAGRLGGGFRLVERSERALFALQGPASEAIMRKYAPAAAELSFMAAREAEIGGVECTVARCGYTGEDGFEISVDHAHAEILARRLLAEDDVIAAGLGARDTLRLEAGLCLYGHELDETVTPVEAGLSWLISKGHDDFPGAEIIVRQLERGPENLRVGLTVGGKPPVRDGAEVYNADGEKVGRVTSGGFAPSLGRPVAMARLKRADAAVGTPLYAVVRAREIELSVTPLPFVPHRYRSHR